MKRLAMKYKRRLGVIFVFSLLAIVFWAFLRSAPSTDSLDNNSLKYAKVPDLKEEGDKSSALSPDEMSPHESARQNRETEQQRFKAFLDKVQVRMPTIEGVKGRNENSLRKSNPELLAGAALIEEIIMQFTEHPELVPQAHVFFADCVKNEALQSAFRSLCLFHVRRIEEMLGLEGLDFSTVSDFGTLEELKTD